MIPRRRVFALVLTASVILISGRLPAAEPTRSESDLKSSAATGLSADVLDHQSKVRAGAGDRSTPIDKSVLWREAQADRERALALKYGGHVPRSTEMPRDKDSDSGTVSGFGFGGACCNPQAPDYECQANIDEFECLDAGWAFAGIGTSCSSGVCLLRCEDSSCDWCWVGTRAQNACPTEWNGDGSCDCGCQYCDSDCPGCGGGGTTRACCGPDNNVDQCLNNNTPAECLALGGAPQDANNCGGVSSCIRCVDECDWCWFGTAAEGNCPPEFQGDGECDCGCQFCDVDCESCGPCCSPSVTDPECLNGVFVDDCLNGDGRFDTEALLCFEADCLPCTQPNCEWCWIGTARENDCEPDWAGDGVCDCGCQFCDPDCPQCQCPVGPVTFQLPPAGAVDARLPRVPLSTAGGPLGTNRFVLRAPAGASAACWSLCVQGPPAYQNAITQITQGGDRYIILTQNTLPPDSCTVLTYTDKNGTRQFAPVYIHPGNVNADNVTNSDDVAALIGYLDGISPPFGNYSTDLDWSGMTTPGDLITLIDMINGANELEPWVNTTRPNCGPCLPP